MTLSPTAQRRFKRVATVYAFQTNGQVTAVNVEHPLHFQLTQAAKLLYHLARTDEYQAVPRLEETAGRLMQYSVITGGSGFTFRAEVAWNATDHQNLLFLKNHAASRGLTRLVTPLNRAFDSVTLLRQPEHAANLLMPELVRVLRHRPAQQSGKGKAFLVITQHGAWTANIEKALEAAGLASSTQVRTRAATRVIPPQPTQTLVVLGAFAENELPGLLTASRCADLVVLRYARPGDPLHETGLFPLSADQVRRDAAVRVVPAPERLRAAALPDVRVPHKTALHFTVSPTTVVPDTVALPMADAERPVVLTDLDEDAAFLNGTRTILPARLSAAVEAWTLHRHDRAVQLAAERGAEDGTTGESSTSGQAVLVLLGGDQRGTPFTFVDPGGPHVDLLTPNADRQADVSGCPPGQLARGQYLLLRTGKGALAARSLAKAQGGDTYDHAEALRREWRRAFEKRVDLDDRKFKDIATTINKCGVFQGTMVRVKPEDVSRWYRTKDLNRPELDSHFEAVLEYAGFTVCGAQSRLPEFTQAMSRVVGAHISAGSHVTDVLLDDIRGRDVTRLLETGAQTFTLPSQPGSGEFTAFEVRGVRPYLHPVNSSAFGMVFRGPVPVDADPLDDPDTTDLPDNPDDL